MNEIPPSNDYAIFNSDPSIIAKLFTKKQILFNMCQALVPKTNIPPIAAAVLIFFSFVQLISLELERSFSSDNLLMILLNNTRLFYEIESVKLPLVYFCALFVLFIFLLIFALCIGIRCFSPLSPFLSYFSFSVPIIYWIGFTPITELLISCWQCDQDGNHIILGSQCWNIIHVICLIFSGLMIGLWILVLFVINITVSHSQPHKHDPYAHFPWNFEIIYTILRILYCLNTRLEIPSFFHILLFIFSLPYFCSILWDTYPYYHPDVAFSFAFGAFCNIVALIISAIKFCFDFSNLGTSGLIGLLAMMFFVLPFLISISQRRWYRFLIAKDSVESVMEVDAKIHILKNILVDGIKYFKGQNEVLDFLHFTDNNTEKGSSPAHNLSVLDSQGVSNSSIDCSSQANLPILLALVSKHNMYEINNPYFILRMSGVHLSIVGNPYVSYKLLLETEKQDPGFLLQFSIYLQMTEILFYVENQNRKAERKFGYSKFQRVILFESEFNNLRKKMVEQATMRIDFWVNLKSNPSLNRIHSLGLDFIKLSKDIKNSWNLLTSLNSQHILALKLFKSYTKNILGDFEETSAIIRKIQQEAFERGWRTLSVGEIFSNEVAIVIISGDEGKILRASSSIEHIFFYNNKELQGRSIQTLMPAIIGAHHKQLMDNFYRNNPNRQAWKQFSTFALNRSGFILPIRTAIQPFFSLSLGLLYIGAIQVSPEYEEEDYILTESSGKIGGITPNVCKQLQLSPSIISERKLYIQNICPDLLEKDIKTLEGGVALKFVSTLCSVGISRSGGNRTSYMEKHEVRCIVKCDVNTEKYSSGLTLKVFKLGKEIMQDLDGKKKQTTISTEILHSISTILKAVRRLKMIAFKAKFKKRLSGNLKPLVEFQNSQHNGDANEEKNPMVSKREDSKRRISGNSRNTPMRRDHESPRKESHREDLHQAASQVPSSSLTNMELLKRTNSFVDREKAFKNNSPIRLVKELSELRKKDPESQRQKPIMSYLKLVTQLFIVLIIMLLSIRVGISVWLNGKVVDSSPIMVANNERLLSLGVIINCMETLTLEFPYGDQGLILINSSQGDTRYNYGYLAAKILPNSTATSCHDYTVIRVKEAIESINLAESIVTRMASDYSHELSDLIDGSQIILHYRINGKFFSVSLQTQVALYTISSSAFRLIEEIEQGTYSNSEYYGEMVINNTMNNFVKGIRPSADIIIASAYDKINLHNDFSTSSFIVLIGLYAIYFFILIPFLYLTNKDMISMTMPFLDIPRQEICEQHEKTLKFLMKIYKSENHKFKETAIDNENEIKSDKDLDEDVQRNEENDATNQEESSEPNNKSSPKRRGSKHSKVRTYIPYDNNIWKLMLIFGISSGFVIGVYFLLDFFSKSLTSVAAYKMTELKAFSRSLYSNMYTVSYIKNYIYSNKTGCCSDNLCEKYLPDFYNLRLNEMNNLLLYHKGNLSLLSKEYDDLFVNVFEKDPCSIPSIGKIENCSTMLGGIFTNGVHAASVGLLDLAISVFRDFQRSPGKWEDISQYINDPRIADIDVLSTLLVGPALDKMIAYLSESLSIDYENGIIVVSCLFSLFIVTFLVISVVWLKSVLNFMDHALFGTKSILSSLPDEIIMKNHTVCRYVFEEEGHVIDDN